METKISNNRLSFATQKMNITYSIAPAIEKNRFGACCRALLRTILLTILQIILSTSFKRRKLHYPRRENGLSLVLQRLILYQESNRKRKKRKVGLNSPPEINISQFDRKIKFSAKDRVENALWCLSTVRGCV